MNHMTIIGNLTADPRENRDSSGVQFAVASNHRWRDRDGEQHVDTTFKDCIAWGDLGQHVLASLHKGDRVFVYGRIEQQAYEAQDSRGETVKRVRDRLVIEAVGPDLRFATAEVTRIARATTDTPVEPEPATAAA